MWAKRVDDVQQDLLRLRFWNRIPAKDSEYWLFGEPAATMDGLRTLPTLLGLDWAWQGDQLLVDFVDGPDSGEADSVSWPEFVEIAATGHRLLVRWEGFNFPLRTLVCPDRGVRISIEHLDEPELQSLHRVVVEKFVPAAVEKAAVRGVLIGCDTRGIVEGNPEQLLGSKVDATYPFLCPDYVLVSPAALSAGIQRDSLQEVHDYGDLLLIFTSA